MQIFLKFWDFLKSLGTKTTIIIILAGFGILLAVKNLTLENSNKNLIAKLNTTTNALTKTTNTLNNVISQAKIDAARASSDYAELEKQWAKIAKNAAAANNVAADKSVKIITKNIEVKSNEKIDCPDPADQHDAYSLRDIQQSFDADNK